jgi:hypothetical protein
VNAAVPQQYDRQPVAACRLSRAQRERTAGSPSWLTGAIVPRLERRQRPRAERVPVPSPNEALVVRIVLTEPEGLYLDDISALLYDVALLNDATVLSSPKYEGYRFDQWFWRRNGRPTKPEDRVAVQQVRHESPFLIEILLGAGGTGGAIAIYKGLEHVWTTKARARARKTTQAIADVDLELRQTELDIKQSEAELKRIEVERAHRELEDEKAPRLILIEANQPPIQVPNEAGPVLRDEESQEYYARTVRRMQRSPLEISKLSKRKARRKGLRPPRDG